jgi:hypothetical protein
MIDYDNADDDGVVQAVIGKENWALLPNCTNDPLPVMRPLNLDSIIPNFPVDMSEPQPFPEDENEDGDFDDDGLFEDEENEDHEIEDGDGWMD